MSEKERPFTVSDRRHFTPDGQTREQEEPRPAECAGDVGAAAPSEDRPQQSRRPAAGAPVSFAEFLLSLGAQAGMLLGGGGEGEDEAASLEGARQMISILEMLQDKTEGRRTAEESRVLDEMLFQLRMGYVQRAGKQ